MSDEKLHSVLVVAGQYDLVQHVERALPASRFHLQIMFNHREMVHLLERQHFDVVVVDAEMVDRYSGDSTLSIALQMVDVPVLALALNQDVYHSALETRAVVIGVMDTLLIRHAISNALRIPIVHDTGILSPETDNPFSNIAGSEFNLLFGLSLSLTEVLELTEVLNRVVESSRNLTSADEAVILMSESNELYMRARVGRGLDDPQNIRLKVRDQLAEEMLQDGLPIIYDSQTSRGITPEYPVKALLYVPIILDGETLGVLGVLNHVKNATFTGYNQQMLQVLSSFAAVAIKNARIHSQSVSRNRDLETLVRGIQTLNTHQPINEALINICQEIANILQVDHSQLFRWDDRNQKIFLQARYDNTTWAIGRGPVVDLDEFDVLYQLIQTEGREKGYCWVDRRFDNQAVQKRLDASGANALLMIPIFDNDSLLGLLRLFFIESLPLELDSIVASQREAIQTIITGVHNDSDYLQNPSNREFVEVIYKRFDADWCDVAVPLRIGNKFSVIMRMGQGSWLETTGPALDLRTYFDLSDAMKSGQPIIAHRSHQETMGRQFLLDQMNAQLLIGVPIIYNNQVYGLGVFASSMPNRVLSEREVMMARALIGHAAIALENVLLFHSLQESLNELRITQEHLIQAERLSAMSEIVYAVADLINNPLTTIMTNVQLLLMDEPDDSPLRAPLELIYRVGRRASSIALNLLALTSINDQSDGPIDIVNSLREVIGLLNAHFEHDGVKLVYDIPDNSFPKVTFLRGRLGDVWINLLRNAHDATKGRDDATVGIEVRLDEQRRSINVRIWDNGKGIPEELHPQIFDLFFTTKPTGEGTGLGLHICREILRSAGGTISFTSQPNVGTSFLIQLPVA
jgi:signal transduction histidine kinase